ncbi:hypothetical protein D5278_09465 [bacterium 1XD21-13]|nr:hypothetical protein [bacterium 1XD21-13]
MEEPRWRIEAHLWFKNFDDYAAREKGLLSLLERIPGNGSVTVFFRATPEYLEIPGASFDYQDEKKTDELIAFCGRDNIDFVARTSLDIKRELGCLRGRQRQDE